MDDIRSSPILLATHILGVLCDQRTKVREEDRAALLALAQDDVERALPLRVLAAIILDRERKPEKP